MEHVRRSGVKPHADWKKDVKAALPKGYWGHAKTFEKIHIDDPARRQKLAFQRHAPAALPLPPRGKKNGEFPPLWGEKKYGVKKDIGRMSRRRCVYCQSNVSSNQPGHVEHFKPKTLFPSLAYEWGNYFLACAACNTNKGNKWPAEHEGEYVRPDRRAPGKRFVFAENGSVKARPGDVEAAAMIRDLKLDRRELRRDRKAQIKPYVDRLRDALKVTKGKARRKLRLQRYLAPPLAMFSQAINQSVRRVYAASLWRRTAPSHGRGAIG